MDFEIIMVNKNHEKKTLDLVLELIVHIVRYPEPNKFVGTSVTLQR